MNFPQTKETTPSTDRLRKRTDPPPHGVPFGYLFGAGRDCFNSDPDEPQGLGVRRAN